MDVVKVLEVGLLVWFAALAVIVATRLLDGDMATSGLLTGDRGNLIDPERPIALALTAAILGYYVIHTLNAGIQYSPAGLPIMPDIPESLVTILTGGNGLYLAGKIARR